MVIRSLRSTLWWILLVAVPGVTLAQNQAEPELFLALTPRLPPQNSAEFLGHVPILSPSLSVATQSAQQTDAERPKSRGAAFFRSLLVPGWGQRYAGARSSSYAFIVSEALLWAGFASQRVYGKWLRDDAEVFAAAHAGVSLEGKPKEFFVDIGNYSSLDAYNNDQLRRRRTTTLYPREPEYDWNWDSEINRLNYRRLRVRSDAAFNRATLLVGAVLANHLISAIHSVWAVNRYNRRFASYPDGLRLAVETRAAGPGVVLRIGYTF